MKWVFGKIRHLFAGTPQDDGEGGLLIDEDALLAEGFEIPDEGESDESGFKD